MNDVGGYHCEVINGLDATTTDWPDSESDESDGSTTVSAITENPVDRLELFDRNRRTNQVGTTHSGNNPNTREQETNSLQSQRPDPQSNQVEKTTSCSIGFRPSRPTRAGETPVCDDIDEVIT